MGEVQQLELNIIASEHKQGMQPLDAQSKSKQENERQAILKASKLSRWIRVSLYATFLLVGQSVAVLLGRLYFTKGGKSKWLETMVQLIGFPFLIPLYYILPMKSNNYDNQTPPKPKPSFLKLGSIYGAVGLLIAFDTMFYAVGLQYLPVSTFTLICASQLAFNALFSFFLNGQKFTPYIVNSLVILTISSILLVFQKNDPSSNPVSKGKYALGFMLTLVASSGSGLTLSLSQLVLEKVLRGRDFKLILDMVIYESLAASCAIAIGLFASGEWNTLKAEMGRYEVGKVSYVMTLVWTALLWQIYFIGCVGLIFEVSSLFSNMISTLALPITPVLAVIFLHDTMDGIKGVSMALAVWGFISYGYQHYLDEYKSKIGNKGVNSDHVALKIEQIVESR